MSNTKIITFDSAATIQAASSDPKGPASFEVIAYTGESLKLANFNLPVVVDLAGMTPLNNLVANLDHDSQKRVGHVTEMINDGQRLVMRGLASAETSHRDEVVVSATNGFKWQASIEARPDKMQMIPKGSSVTVNARKFEGPILVARKSVIRGFAFVSHGADDNTTVRIAAEAATHKELSMEFIKWIEAVGFSASEFEELNEKQKAGLKTRYDSEVADIEARAAADKANKKTPDEIPLPAFDADDIKAAASDHLANLEAIFAQHEGDVKQDEFATIRAEASKTAKALKVEAMKHRWTAEKYEAKLMKAEGTAELKLVRANRPKGPAIHAPHNDIAGNVIEAALCQVVGLPEIEKHYDDKTLQAAHTAFKGRIGLQQIIIMAAQSGGMNIMPGEKLHDGNLRDALRCAFGRDIQAGFSTVSLPGVFSNVANKELLAGYLEEDQLWRELATVKTSTDFKATTSYRLMDDMEYEELSPSGEIKHGSVAEESFSRQAKTYAKMFSLTRVDIINDDLGAFDDLRTRLGRGASKKFNKVFWATFMNNSSFFTAARTNYIDGATTNLGTDGVGLGLGVKAVRKMTSPSADGLKHVGAGVMPKILLVPPELEQIADVLYKNTNYGAVANSGVNTFAGKYRPVVVWQLSDAAYTGYSTTAWYLLGDSLRPMVVSFLNGNQSPTVESAEADFNTLGIQFRGFHDWGADRGEYLSGVMSKGAA